MRFRFLPKGLFRAADRYGRRLHGPAVDAILRYRPPKGCCTFPDTCSKCMPPPSLLTSRKEDRYGDDRTIHTSGDVNVEIGPTGDVVAVWFRCRMLPFTQTRVDDSRAAAMHNHPPEIISDIKAIVFDTQERQSA